MSLQIVDVSTRNAVAASTNQEGWVTALTASWASADVTVRVLTAGAVVLRVQTYGPWVVDTAATPRVVRLGAVLATTEIAQGVPALIEFVQGSTVIFTVTAGVGTGDFSFARSFIALSRPRLDAVDDLPAIRFLAPAGLPLTAPPPAQVVPIMTLAAGASNGDSNTAWNEWLLGVANAVTGGLLRIIANTGLASRTIAGSLASVDNQWDAADPGLAGLGALGWVSSMIGTNDARGGAVMSGTNQTNWIAYKNKVLTYAQVMIVIAIPPVRATGGSHNVGTFNDFFQAQCAADPTRLIYVDPWGVAQDSSGCWLPDDTPSDGGAEKVHPGTATRSRVAQRAAELLGRFFRAQPLASPLLTSAADVYPTIPQTWPAPVNAGTGGSNAIGSGSVPTGITVTREGFPGAINTTIVAADPWDANQTPWLRLDLAETAGGSAALIVQAVRSGAAVTSSSPAQIDFSCEIRLENVNTAAVESITARAYGVNNEELIPANPLVLEGNGVLSARYVYRTAVNRRMASAAAHASVTHQLRIETAMAASSGLGRIFVRRIGFRES